MTERHAHAIPCAAAVLALAGSALFCGPFSPRVVEPPQSTAQRGILRLYTIADNTEIRLENLQYEELFHDQCVYEDDFARQYAKSEIIDRLNNIEAQYSISSARWDTIGGRNDIIAVSQNTATLYRQYSIIAAEKGGEVREYAGEASFQLIYEDEWKRWRILRWRDGARSGQDKTIFHPEFIE